MTEPIEKPLRDQIANRVERLTSAVWPKEGKADPAEVGDSMSDLLEFVLGRATGLASATVRAFDGRLRELEATAKSTENRVATNSTRLNELNRRLNGKAELIDEQADKMEQQEVRIGNLERMVGQRPEATDDARRTL